MHRGGAAVPKPPSSPYWIGDLWVNGKEVGEHTGGYDPFTFDITDALKDGENEIVVAVTDPTDTGTQPRGKQVLKPHGIFYTAVTGIWQTVWLEPVPKQHIESYKVVPDIDGKVATVTVQATGKGEITVQFDSMHKVGRQNKVATVISNASAGNSQITFSVNVLEKKKT